MYKEGLPVSFYAVVDHKVIVHVSPPYTLTKYRLPFPHTQLDQIFKHMIQSVLWHPQRQSIGSILDLKQLTS